MGHGHPHVTPELNRYREVRRITVIGGVVDLVLGIVKILVGYAAHSQALIADGIHSLSDLGTDFLVLFAAKHGSRGADEDHPYGHGRIETLATVVLGAALVLVAVGIVVDAVNRLMNPDKLLQPGMIALAVAAVSIVAKEVIYRYTMRVADRLNSDLLRANAWHSRSDAVSSIVVLIGIAGTMLGYPYLDALAAMGVAIMIGKIAWELSWRSMRELADEGLESDRVAMIRSIIQSVKGVRSLHTLRTRKSGGSALVDVHIQVGSRLSVSEGHQIGENVRKKLVQDIPEINDVTVHIDPEDDETSRPCDHLPSREVMMEHLAAQWRDIPEMADAERITLHYLDGRIHVDVILPLSLTDNRAQAGALAARVQVASSLDHIGDVQVYFH